MPIPRNSSLSNPFAALRHKSFRLYWLGMCVSLIGTWMQNVAEPWLAYSLTGSPLLLSLVGMLQFLPMLFFSLFAGVIIDRFPKKILLICTQTGALLVTLSLSILIWSGSIQYWHLLVAATVLGLVNTLDMPLRQAFVIEMVGKEDLMNAIALNSSVFNVARVLGPAVAGVLMSTVGIAVCYAINAASFLAVIVSLFFIRPRPVARNESVNGGMLKSIREGLKYIRANRLLLKTLGLVLIVGTFAMNFNVLVPVFSKAVLGQEETGYGLLMSFVGIGSFTGAMLVAAMCKKGPRQTVLNVFPLLIGALLVLTGLTGAYALTALGLAAAGFCFVSFTSTANTTLQLNTPDEYRGRVMSVYAWVFGGSTPAGNLFSGTVAEHAGPALGFIACGAMILLPVGIWMLWRRKRKRAAA
jgi:predicted MFS family arabinose efflux permease